MNIEVQELLSKEGKIPPKALRPYLSHDGQELWDTVDFEYQHLHQELKAYFQGLPSQLESLPEQWRVYLEAKKRWFLSLYELIRQAWSHLTPYHQDRHGNPLTPGLLAAELLEIQCKGELLPAIAGRAEIAPRRNYELGAKIAKARHKGTRATDQLMKDARRGWGEFYESASYIVAVLSHCRAASHDKYVKQSLKAYDLAASELDAIIIKQGQYAKCKTQVWEKGSRKSS
jgi:hypothetical protein